MWLTKYMTVKTVADRLPDIEHVRVQICISYGAMNSNVFDILEEY